MYVTTPYNFKFLLQSRPELIVSNSFHFWLLRGLFKGIVFRKLFTEIVRPVCTGTYILIYILIESRFLLVDIIPVEAVNVSDNRSALFKWKLVITRMRVHIQQSALVIVTMFFVFAHSSTNLTSVAPFYIRLSDE